MIRLIEARNYRSLRHVRQPLKPFQVLVGPNASGKSTFLDVLAFLGDLISDGLEAAVEKRTSNFYDLLWQRTGEGFELAVEAEIPEEHRVHPDISFDTIGYGLAVGLPSPDEGLRIVREQITLTDRSTEPWREEMLVLRKEELVDNPAEPSLFVRDERGLEGGPEAATVDPDSPIIWWLPDHSFPATAWLADLAARRVRWCDLSNAMLRRPSPPGKGAKLRGDGSNLAGVISRLREDKPQRFADWLGHLRTALPDMADVRVVERPEDRHQYLMLKYDNGLEVPSWMLSGGTLHLLALTIIAYLPDDPGIWLIEEPENSVHPLNCETVMQSLQSVYDGQVLVATHSPVVLGLVKPEDVLVFSHDDEKGTQITVGSDHPGLRDWKGEVSLGTLFAGGVLG